MTDFNKRVYISLDDLHDEPHTEQEYIDIDAKDLDMAKKVFDQEMEDELSQEAKERVRRIRLRTGINPDSKSSKWDRFKVD